MSNFLQELAERRRFGMKPGLDTISAVCEVLGNPEQRLRNVIHVAGTNGKGATCAILDACLRAAGRTVGRYTSPHLVRLNERFFLNGSPISDAALETASQSVSFTIKQSNNQTNQTISDLTFFEALTAVGFLVYAEADPDFTILETGLGGRLDATNICRPALTIITRIGLDHCDWLGDTVEKIAAEKAGIIKPGVPIVLGRNVDSVVEVVRARANELGSPFYYAPDLATEAEIPADFSLAGSFNRENALTALAALKVLEGLAELDALDALGRLASLGFLAGFPRVVWPGRFQRIGNFIVDGAHNPPAARALASALSEAGFGPSSAIKQPVRHSLGEGGSNKSNNQTILICGFCGDKDIEETLRILKPYVSHALAVRTNNPRSLSPEELVSKLSALGISSEPCDSLSSAIKQSNKSNNQTILICGSLFLAGEALVALGACPWQSDRFDASELLHTS